MENKKSQFAYTLKLFFRNKGAVLGCIIMAIWIFAAIFTDFIAPYDPYARVGKSQQAPNAQFIMGTDKIGRDVFSRLLYGSRTSLILGFICVTISSVVGTVLGLIAGYNSGTWIDSIIMRVMDALLAFPGMLLSLIIIASLGASIRNVMIAVGISSIPSYARLVRSSVLSIKEMTYIEAAKVTGADTWRIMFKHILPNGLSPIIVLATLQVGSAILTGAGMSFLGMGAQPPSPEWGLATSQGREILNKAWWISTFPGLAILTVVISANLIGDGMRYALDPRMKIEQ